MYVPALKTEYFSLDVESKKLLLGVFIILYQIDIIEATIVMDVVNHIQLYDNRRI